MTDLPPKVAKAPPRPETQAVCLVVHESQEDEGDEDAAGISFLVVQRPDTGLLASLWEFPSVPVFVLAKICPSDA